jgi:hypothetical protein
MRVLARHSLDSLFLLTAAWAGCTFASEQFPLTLTDCANIVNDAQRLA